MALTLEQFLLTKLAEEASEIAQIALKAQQFGMEEKHPDLSENNRERMYKELNDLNAIVVLLNEWVAFDYKIDQDDMYKKYAKVRHYLEYSRSLGLVEAA